MTHLNSKAKLNFTNLFSKLKDAQSEQQRHLRTLSSFKTKTRPESMHQKHLTNQEERFSLRSSCYFKRTFSEQKENNEICKSSKLFESCSKFKENRPGLKFLALSNSCLKKVKEERCKTEIFSTTEKKLKVNSLEFHIPENNPECTYRTKTLKALKRNKKFGYVVKARSEFGRIEGHKII